MTLPVKLQQLFRPVLFTLELLGFGDKVLLSGFKSVK